MNELVTQDNQNTIKTTGGTSRMDPAGFMVGLIGVGIGILLSYLFEKRHILGKKEES